MRKLSEEQTLLVRGGVKWMGHIYTYIYTHKYIYIYAKAFGKHVLDPFLLFFKKSNAVLRSWAQTF